MTNASCFFAKSNETAAGVTFCCAILLQLRYRYRKQPKIIATSPRHSTAVFGNSSTDSLSVSCFVPILKMSPLSCKFLRNMNRLTLTKLNLEFFERYFFFLLLFFFYPIQLTRFTDFRFTNHRISIHSKKVLLMNYTLRYYNLKALPPFFLFKCTGICVPRKNPCTCAN